MPVLGITGGIATGKTLFTECLIRLCPALRLFDADRCARELTASDPAIRAAIRDCFGPAVFDAGGTLQRAVLREIIFNHPTQREALENILHPAIRRSWIRLAEEIRSEPGEPWLAVDIPLLFETSAETNFDKILVVACSASTQRKRLVESRRLDPDLLEKMIASQMPLEEKMRRADFLVWNEGMPEALESQARLLSLRLFP